MAAVNPDLVVRDDKDEIYTVRYDAVNAMLLNRSVLNSCSAGNAQSHDLSVSANG